LLMLTVPVTTSAATYYSIASGNWTNPAIWSTTANGTSCGCTPKGSDNVYISHSVTLDRHLTNGNGALGGISGTYYIYANGRLLGGSTYNVNVLANGSLTVCGQLTAVNIEFYNGSTFRFCAGSSVTIYGNFINRNNSPGILIDGIVYITQAFENGNGAIITGSGQFIINNGLAINNGSLFGCVSQYPCGQYPCAINSYCGSSTFLPVDFVAFSVEESKHGVQINWSTATEINADRFEIQRSVDASDFQTIASIPAAGNSSLIRYYSYLDKSFSTFETAYYRIMEVDADGKSTYSEIRKFGRQVETSFTVFPNPLEGNKLSGSIRGTHLDEWQMTVTDPTGRPVMSFNGNKATLDNGNFTFSLPEGLLPGSYFLTLTCGDLTGTQKMLVRP
jgi:hypothetical protein